MTSPILNVSELTTSFRVDGKWMPVVRDLSFQIRPRETVAVVGESGSGKSVTALSIMRLVAEATGRIEGRIELEGKSLLDLSEPAMRDIRGGSIGMIFQEPMTSLNPVLTVGFQVAEVLQRHRGMDAAAAQAETLRLFDLVRIADAENRLHEFPHTFSGGMRQRIMIAIALACQPRLLIADEPTTALDVTIQAQILELIRELQSDVGMAVMFITHDMEWLQKLLIVLWLCSPAIRSRKAPLNLCLRTQSISIPASFWRPCRVWAHCPVPTCPDGFNLSKWWERRKLTNQTIEAM